MHACRLAHRQELTDGVSRHDADDRAVLHDDDRLAAFCFEARESPFQHFRGIGQLEPVAHGALHRRVRPDLRERSEDAVLRHDPDHAPVTYDGEYAVPARDDRVDDGAERHRWVQC